MCYVLVSYVNDICDLCKCGVYLCVHICVSECHWPLCPEVNISDVAEKAREGAVWYTVSKDKHKGLLLEVSSLHNSIPKLIFADELSNRFSFRNRCIFWFGMQYFHYTACFCFRFALFCFFSVGHFNTPTHDFFVPAFSLLPSLPIHLIHCLCVNRTVPSFLLRAEETYVRKNEGKASERCVVLRIVYGWWVFVWGSLWGGECLYKRESERKMQWIWPTNSRFFLCLVDIVTSI